MNPEHYKDVFLEMWSEITDADASYVDSNHYLSVLWRNFSRSHLTASYTALPMVLYTHGLMYFVYVVKEYYRTAKENCHP